MRSPLCLPSLNSFTNVFQTTFVEFMLGWHSQLRTLAEFGRAHALGFCKPVGGWLLRFMEVARDCSPYRIDMSVSQIAILPHTLEYANIRKDVV